MKRQMFCFAMALAALVAFSASEASAIGIPAKLKGKKVQADLVPAYQCSGTATDPVDCDGTSLSPAVQNSSCSIQGGKIKVQVGKDAGVLIKGLKCSGPLPSALCVQVDGMSTIMDEELDKDGNSVGPETCTFASLPVAGTSNYTATSVGSISCNSKGICKGAVPNTAVDPCPDVDKVIEVRRIRVFDGPEDTLVEISPGVFLGACDPVNSVVARPGQVTQTKP